MRRLIFFFLFAGVLAGLGSQGLANVEQTIKNRSYLIEQKLNR
jgi:hypothetical protein